ncbi:MAG: glycosyltransferase family 39 protein [Anaerolineales bacterium]|nr:glycosyltransferase family 39 protein [Anaerolineales bacterium]
MTDQHTGMEGNSMKARRFIAFIGFALLLLSQILIASQPVNDAVVFPPYTGLAVAGAVLFLIGLTVRPTALLQKLSDHALLRDGAFWHLFAITLSVLAAYGATLPQRNYIPVMSIWLMGAIGYLFVFADGGVSFETLKEKIRKNHTEILLVLVIVIVAVTVRFYNLGQVPRVLDGDEGLVGLAAQSTAEGRLTNPFALWENFGALYLQAINIALRSFGATSFALRLMPAIGGVIAIPALYLFARQISGPRIALIAAVLLAISHTHINFSRIASVAYIHGTWLVPLELYFLLSGFEKRQAWRTALSGILVAIHFSVYLTAQVIIGLVFIYMALALIFYRTWFKTVARVALAFWGGFLVAILPEAIYISRNMNEFLNRLAQNGTFQSGWLDVTIQSTGQSAATILFGRVVHAFMALIYYPAFDFYGSPVPMLTVVSSVLFLIGLAVSLVRTRLREYLLLNGYFWGATFSVGLFAIPPSADSYRMLMAFPAALIMCAIGLDQVLELFGIGWRNTKKVYAASVSFVLLSLLILNMWTYFGDFAGQCRFGGNLAGRFASYLGSYVRTVESESSVYLLSDGQFFYGSHASTDFLSQLRPIINHPDPIDSLHAINGETIVANPDRIKELEDWVRLNPGGEVHYVYDCKNTILMAYQVP